MKIEDAKQVLDWLGAFQEQDKDKTLSPVAFGEWLQQQGEAAPQPAVLPPNTDGLISMFFGFMANYAAYYARRIFRHLDLYSMTDWAFLATLEQEEPLTKSVLIQKNILEKSTGTEVLKRLKKQGYIEELSNPEDRRAKLVRLSDKGRKVVAEANARIIPMGEVVTGDLTMAEKQQLLNLLQKLHRFHQPIFEGADERELQALLHL
ncbi:MarR family winged helix-turn-helix transcriptional regulator [Phaeodactylibacter xiamenensis]|jgi:DNA-binding MarR family transcriptional regulator|uniref:MarR family winged helix-turn-helix transcriptional regulator n=1 Tax=Phaeodactylibacter xiamenensis TaxID=1524460 RepID=UPI0024A83E2C|nr:winged helix DNA-binding protein [Phaeodactylibacter xiamenensis]